MQVSGIVRSFVILLATLFALALGLQFAHVGHSFTVDKPAAERFLKEFRGLEHNPTDSFRWSLRYASLTLPGFERLPLILDMRLTAPRPFDAPAAETVLERGTWRSAPFLVSGDWRRYQVLLPPAVIEPDIRLRIATFEARGGDRLGAALSDLRASPAIGQPWAVLGFLALGWQRLLLFCMLPLVLFFGIRRLLTGSFLAFAVAGLTILVVGWAAAFPLLTVELLPEAWLLPIGALLGIVAWFALRPVGLEQRLRALLDHDQTRLAIVLGVGLVQGVIFLVLLPPWQHYDEPAHFEYAWLIANHQSWPTPATTDPRVSILGGEGRALHHPPAYHFIVSLPLRLASNLDLTAQLYIARSVSLLFFLITIAIATGMVRDLTKPEQPLRWAVPLLMALLPTFADIMTAVNNDAGAIMLGAAFCWAAVRLIRFGPSPWRLIGLWGAALLGFFTKNTAAVFLVLAPLAWLTAIGAQRDWRDWPLIRRLTLIFVVIGVCAIILSFGWGEPAYWYRWGATSGSTATRVQRSDAPVGANALRLEGVAEPNFEGLSAPLLPDDIRDIAGHKITVGAWVWASRPAVIWGPGVTFNDGTGPLSSDTRLIQVGTTPTFIAWVFDAPDRLSSLQYMAWAVAPGDSEPLEIYYDGAVLVLGEFSAAVPPQFENTAAQRGIWDERQFTNLIRNGAAEQAWPQLHPAIEQATTRYIRRSPSQVISALLDHERLGQILIVEVLPWVIYAFFSIYAWGQVLLRDPAWQYLFPLVALIVLPGCIRQLIRPPAVETPAVRPALAFLGLTALLVWGNVLLRLLPALQTSPPPFPRYGFPALIPVLLALAGGWQMLWPARFQARAAVFLVGSMALLDLKAIDTIMRFFRSSCSTTPEACGFIAAPSLMHQPLVAGLLLLLASVALYRGLFMGLRQPRNIPPSSNTPQNAG